MKAGPAPSRPAIKPLKNRDVNCFGVFPLSPAGFTGAQRPQSSQTPILVDREMAFFGARNQPEPTGESP